MYVCTLYIYKPQGEANKLSCWGSERGPFCVMSRVGVNVSTNELMPRPARQKKKKLAQRFDLKKDRLNTAILRHISSNTQHSIYYNAQV